MLTFNSNIPGIWLVHNIPPGTGGMSSDLLRNPEPQVKSYATKDKKERRKEWKRIEKQKKVKTSGRRMTYMKMTRIHTYQQSTIASL
jgi:hypothetical protein